ncbi:MAG: preprotein translocase subunit YajC [Myxococcales bacterium]
MYGLLHILTTWLQPDASSGAAPVSSSPARAPGGLDGGLTNIGLMALMMVVFWLVLIRPQQKKQKELDALLKQLKKGQKVRTSGGIRGEIVDFKTEAGDEVVLMIADRVKINILRSHVAGLVEQGEQEQKS